jgi:hypothetical protein
MPCRHQPQPHGQALRAVHSSRALPLGAPAAVPRAAARLSPRRITTRQRGLPQPVRHAQQLLTTSTLAPARAIVRLHVRLLAVALGVASRTTDPVPLAALAARAACARCSSRRTSPSSCSTAARTQRRSRHSTACGCGACWTCSCLRWAVHAHSAAQAAAVARVLQARHRAAWLPSPAASSQASVTLCMSGAARCRAVPLLRWRSGATALRAPVKWTLWLGCQRRSSCTWMPRGARVTGETRIRRKMC